MDRGETKQSLVSPLLFLKNLNRISSENAFQEIPVFPFAAGIEDECEPRYVIKDSDFVAGDIVLWNGKRKIVVDGEKYSANAFPEDVFTPIGVVVIPESHMYNGKARMMATRWMSCDEPENGSILPQTMFWGSDADLSGLTLFDKVPVIARYDDENAGGITALTNPQAVYTTNDYSFLPSDYPSWTGETNPEDEGTRWCQSNTYWTNLEHEEVEAYNYYTPSPYASDGTPNPLYRATEYSGGSINNPLSYFDGKHQTNIILETRGAKDYGNWKPTASTPEDYPAASCCDMYHTVGTSQGDWYLPSCAELGYVVARLNRINSAMAKVNGLQMLSSDWVWSSSLYDNTQARRIIVDEGRVGFWNFIDSTPHFTFAFAVI